MARTSARDWFVAVQVNAVSLVDEGVGRVLDLFRNEALADTVMLTVHGFNPEVIERPRDHSGHGRGGRVGTAGGTFSFTHPEFYKGIALGDSRVRDSFFAGFDALAETRRAAKARGMGVYLYILESASTGGRQRAVAGWPRLLEIDVHGRRAALPCVNNPTYREWKHALVEDIYKSYDFDGMLWGAERWGPLSIALMGQAPTCFCSHCAAVALGHGLDWRRTEAGYRALAEAIAAWRGGAVAEQTPFTLFLRILLDHPEILAWERLWSQRHMALYKELYGIAKWLEPKRPFGLGLWHYYVTSPLLRAEWDMKELARSADFIRPIVYHFPQPARMRFFLETLREGVFRPFSNDGLWAAFCQMQDLKLPSFSELQRSGMPGDLVRQAVEIVRRDVGAKMPIYPGIGIDVRQHGQSARMQPRHVVDAVKAAAQAGADGITASRNYAEMRIANLKAFGRALGGLGRRG